MSDFTPETIAAVIAAGSLGPAVTLWAWAVLFLHGGEALQDVAAVAREIGLILAGLRAAVELVRRGGAVLRWWRSSRRKLREQSA